LPPLLKFFAMDSGLKGFSLDVNRKILWRDGQIVDLPPKAVEMLIVLLRNRGNVVTKQELLDSIWGDTFVEESVLSNNVYLLRKAIGELEPGRQLITTVPRRGYKFENPNDAGTDFVLEHHVFDQTTVEDVSSQPDQRNSYRITAPSLSSPASRPRRYVLRAAAALLIVGTAIGLLAVRQSPSSSSGLSEIRSIAVLPPNPLGKGEDEAVLSFGIADALITQLGNSQRLVVQPLSAVSDYPQTSANGREIGTRLGVDAVMEGTIQRAGDQLRVTIRLLRVADGTQVWSGTFNESRQDIFALQDSIAGSVSAALFGALSVAEREVILSRYKTNIPAYESYLRGRYEYFRYGQPPVDRYPRAIAEFEKALDEDPNYALALAGIADAYSQLANYSSGELRVERYEKAKTFATRALAIDDKLAETHAAIGWINRIYDWDWEASERHLTRAIELSPNEARYRYMYAYLLVTLGRTGEAIEQARRSRDLDPVTKTNVYALALASHRRFDEALAVMLPTLESTHDTSQWRNAISYYLHAGKPADALALFERTPENVRTEFATEVFVPVIYSRLGDNARADSALLDLEQKADANIGRHVRLAATYAALGMNDKAIAALEQGLPSRDDRMMWIKTNPFFDGLRDDPRFDAVVRKMNL
jgi:TolB-like protein/DNA-binding winged helix-turn-helix (wHTH) protein